jgi:uncharacterized protein (DUF2147 family)
MIKTMAGRLWITAVFILAAANGTAMAESPRPMESANLVAAVAGPWATHEGGEVMFHPCGDALCGTVTALRPADAILQPLDKNNPDPALRDRPLLGLTMFTDLTADSDGKWTDGALYNSETGKTYRSKIRLNEDGTLKISGCISFFCKSFDWQKVKDPSHE